MNEAKLEKQKQNLVELGVMDPSDTLVDYLQASYVERLIVLTGLLADNIVVPYRNIRELGKCSQLLVPIGITITYEEMETGKLVTDKISMMKRDKWIDFMAQKAGI